MGLTFPEKASFSLVLGKTGIVFLLEKNEKQDANGFQIVVHYET